MLRIGSRFSGVDFAAQTKLFGALNDLAESSNRLATLRRINKGSDDPAGLIALETLRSELVSLDKAVEASERTRALVRVADSGLSQATSLLNDIRGNLVTAASGTTSDAEKAALQLEVDAAIEALDRIGASTSLAGVSALDGSSLTVLVGPSPADTTTLELPGIDSSALGDGSGIVADLRSGGSANLVDGDLNRASEIIDAALSQAFDDRARLGAFERNSIDSTQNVLNSTIQNISGAISQIGDADIGRETANQARSLILVESSAAAFRDTVESRRAALALLGGSFD